MFKVSEDVTVSQIGAIFIPVYILSGDIFDGENGE